MKIFLSIVLLITSLFGFSQSSTRGALVTVDTSNFSNSAGFIRPTIKMLAVNRLDNAVVYWDLSSWSTVATSGSGGSGWALTGNSGTTAGINFIGTTDDIDLILKRNSLQLIRLKDNYRVEIGNGPLASGQFAVAIGNGSIASGLNSTALNSGQATGNNTVAIGTGSIASYNYAIAAGVSSISSGEASFSANETTSASGVASSAFGAATTSKSYAGFVIGSYNDSTDAVDAGTYNGLNRAFQVGIGQSDGTRSNAMTILFNGNTGIGTVSPTSKLQVVGLPVYANNAAAIAGGLTVGAFYRTGADPDPVCVVH